MEIRYGTWAVHAELSDRFDQLRLRRQTRRQTRRLRRRGAGKPEAPQAGHRTP